MEGRGKGRGGRGGSKRRGGGAGDVVGGDEFLKRSRQQESSDGSGKDDIFDWAQPYKTSKALKSCEKETEGKAARGGIRGGAGEGTSGGSSEGSFEEHSCNLAENCTDRHESQTPYLWRVKLNEQWVRLTKENSTIEKAFCDPNVEEFWDVESIPVSSSIDLKEYILQPMRRFWLHYLALCQLTYCNKL